MHFGARRYLVAWRKGHLLPGIVGEGTVTIVNQVFREPAMEKIILYPEGQPVDGRKGNISFDAVHTRGTRVGGQCFKGCRACFNNLQVRITIKKPCDVHLQAVIKTEEFST